MEVENLDIGDLQMLTMRHNLEAGRLVSILNSVKNRFEYTRQFSLET